MKKILYVLIIIFGSFVSLFTISEFSIAYGKYGCDTMSLEQAFYNSDVVFSGKVISTNYVDKYQDIHHPSGAQIVFDPIIEKRFVLLFENGTSISFEGQYDTIQFELSETFKGYLHQTVILKNNLWTIEDPYYPPRPIIGEESIIFAKYYDGVLGYSTCSPIPPSNPLYLTLIRIYSISDFWTVVKIIMGIIITITFYISIKKLKTIKTLFKRSQE